MNAAAPPRNAEPDLKLSITASEIRWHDPGVDAGSSTEPSPTVEGGEVARRFAAWREAYGISDPVGLFQLEQLVTETVRIERCQSEERLRIERISERAGACWDEDREAEVQGLVRKLARDPERYAVELGLTPHGCAWMIEQWKALALALENPEGWNARQRSRALDLLGVPTIFRDGCTPIDPDCNTDANRHRSALVARQVEFLAGLIDESRADLDEGDRLRAEQGLAPGHDRGLAALRRFEAGCHRRFDKALKSLQPRVQPRDRIEVEPKQTTREVAPSDDSPWKPEAEPELIDLDERIRPLSVRTETSIKPRPLGNRRQRRKQEALARRA